MAVPVQPLIIEVRLNEWAKREPHPSMPTNPYVPYSPAEIAADAAACINEGATIVHYHPRDPVTGAKSRDLAIYSDSVRLIKTRQPEAIVMPTLGMDSLADDLRIESLTGMKQAGHVMPELAPIDVISCNRDLYLPRDRTYTRFTDDPVYENFPSTWMNLADAMTRLDVKPVPILWDIGSIRNTQALVEIGKLRPPYFCELVLTEGGLLVSHPGTVKGLQALLDFFPEHPDWLWTVLLWGATLLPVAAAAIGLGGHVSIGLGDYHYRELGSPTNAELVRRVRRIAEAVGRPVATAAEARQMLGLRA